MKKTISLSVDDQLYEAYKLYCDKKGFIVSRQFEIMMEAQMKSSK